MAAAPALPLALALAAAAAPAETRRVQRLVGVVGSAAHAGAV